MKCLILTGSHKGEFCIIPKIKNITNTKELPFQFTRYQLPVSLCYAMTINKAQGQTFDQIGIFLDEPLFSHGQLYVALSRTRFSDKIKIELKEGKNQGLATNNKYFIQNIVYR